MLLFQLTQRQEKQESQKNKTIPVGEAIIELEAAKKALEKSMAEAKLGEAQKGLVRSVFASLVKERKLKAGDALFLAETLMDKESDLSEFVTRNHKSVLELYDGFGKEEWVRFLLLVKAFKEDKTFGKSAKTFDERHGNRKGDLLSAARYTATTLHTALKPMHVGGALEYQGDMVGGSFGRQLDMAREIFGNLADKMFNEIQPKSTSGVVN